MTLKERVAQENPTAIKDIYLGGVCGCPAKYEYLKDSRCLTNCGIARMSIDKQSEICKHCWERPFTEIGTPKISHSEIDTKVSMLTM